ncbi:MAG: N-6 DNA methylase [Polyangiaceae bacterium]
MASKERTTRADWQAKLTAELAERGPARLPEIVRAALATADPVELGNVYEALLEQGAKRRAAGAYYTPDELIDAVLTDALEPLIARALEGATPTAHAEALLAIRVVDPACGSGRFLRAAATSLASAYSRVTNLAPERALAAVLASCIHGVDVDPVATELASAALLRDVGARDRAKLRPILGARIVAANALVADWPALFPDVFARGGFDLVVGNPPWIAHAGRAAQPVEPKLRAHFQREYRAFAGYPTTHGMFVERAASLLREGGHLGLVIPSSVSELGGYRGARAAHDALCEVPNELDDFGEGRFAAVTQPCMALVSRRVAGGRTDAPHGSPWPMKRPDLDERARRLLARLSLLPTLPAETFGERGVQSDRAMLEHFTEASAPTGRFTTPIREGTDVREFQLLAPRLHVDARALGSRMRSEDEFRAVHVVVRQTARYPIASLSDGLAFRNSLLAGFASDALPADALVALLNSALVRWLHFTRFRDARQPILPQVKITHLRSIVIPRDFVGVCTLQLARAGSAMKHAGSAPTASERRALDDLVFDLYGLDEDERALVRTWHEQPARPRRGPESVTSA